VNFDFYTRWEVTPGNDKGVAKMDSPSLRLGQAPVKPANDDDKFQFVGETIF
jgi:hypothetical protein